MKRILQLLVIAVAAAFAYYYFVPGATPPDFGKLTAALNSAVAWVEGKTSGVKLPVATALPATPAPTPWIPDAKTYHLKNGQTITGQIVATSPDAVMIHTTDGKTVEVPAKSLIKP